MFKRVVPTALVLASFVGTAQAQDITSATGLFFDVNVGAAFRSGTSNTTTGGRYHSGNVKDSISQRPTRSAARSAIACPRNWRLRQRQPYIGRVELGGVVSGD